MCDALNVLIPFVQFQKRYNDICALYLIDVISIKYQWVVEFIVGEF